MLRWWWFGSLCRLNCPSPPSSRSASVQQRRRRAELWRPDGALCCRWVMVIVVSRRFVLHFVVVVGWLRCRLLVHSMRNSRNDRSLSPQTPASIAYSLVRRALFQYRQLCG